MAKFGSASLAKLKGVHPDLVRVMNAAITDSPVDFSIVYGVRTQAEQVGLYALGRTKVNPDGKSAKKPLGNIVTQKNGTTNKSNHQVKSSGFGEAIDFCPYINGKLDWGNDAAFKLIVVHVKAIAKCLNIPIVCGIDWKSLPDAPHVELAK